MTLRRLAWYVLLTTTVAVLGGLVGFGVARLTEQQPWPNLVFTSEKWNTMAQDERYVFWNDIDRRRVLIGRSLEEVVKLLGRPDSEASDHRRVTYVIKGAEGEYNMNFIYFMDIRFDGSGRVQTVTIGTD
jgi:hypothetical protein